MAVSELIVEDPSLPLKFVQSVDESRPVEPEFARPLNVVPLTVMAGTEIPPANDEVAVESVAMKY